MEKNVRVVMLAEKKAPDCTGLIKCIKDWKSYVVPEEDFNSVGDLSIGINTSLGVFEFWEPQNLYFISDEEIREGEWIIDSAKKLRRAKRHVYKKEAIRMFKNIGLGKVIASTDKNLGRLIKGSGVQLQYPLVPKSFVEKFAESNGCLDTVKVEFEQLCIQTGAPCGVTCFSEEACDGSIYPKTNNDGVIKIIK